MEMEMVAALESAHTFRVSNYIGKQNEQRDDDDDDSIPHIEYMETFSQTHLTNVQMPECFGSYANIVRRTHVRAQTHSQRRIIVHTIEMKW